MNSLETLDAYQPVKLFRYDKTSRYLEDKNNPFKVSVGFSFTNSDIAQEEINIEIGKLNQEVDRLTNHADQLDYKVAAGCGTLAGLIDVFWVGGFDIIKINKGGTETVEKLIKKAAALLTDYNEEDDNLAEAIRCLEDAFPIPADKATDAFGGPTKHHCEDFSHHPTIVGLICSLLTQFTGKVFGSDGLGKIKTENIDPNLYPDLFGKNILEKISKGILDWIGHLISDMGGSYGSVAKSSKGTGIPGPIGSMLKEFFSLPIFKNCKKEDIKKLSQKLWEMLSGDPITDLYGNKILNENGQPIRFDFRTEFGIYKFAARQTVPVIFNEVLVRTFYFIRHLCNEIEEKDIRTFSDIKKIEWEKTLPLNNRTIVRMMTVSTSLMEACDWGDIAIRAYYHLKINIPIPKEPLYFTVAKRINYIGMGRWGYAVYSDIKMKSERAQLKDKIEFLKDPEKQLGPDLAFLAYLDHKQIDQLADMIIENAPPTQLIEKLAPTKCAFISNRLSKLPARKFESLSGSEEYKKYKEECANHSGYCNEAIYREYLKKVVDEYLDFGGYDILNKIGEYHIRNMTLGRKHVSYHEILCDVLKKFSIEYDNKSDTYQLEDILLSELVVKTWKNMSDDMRKEIIEDAEKDFNQLDENTQITFYWTGPEILIAFFNYGFLASFAQHFITDKILSMIICVLFGNEVKTNESLTKSLAYRLNSWNSLTNLGLSSFALLGPAYRVTVPCTILIAGFDKVCCCQGNIQEFSESSLDQPRDNLV